MKTVKLTSISRILANVSKLKLDKIDVINWTGEALEAIGGKMPYEEAVAFLEIKDHQAPLPNNLHFIIQVARANDFDKQKSKMCPKVIREELEPDIPKQEDGPYHNIDPNKPEDFILMDLCSTVITDNGFPIDESNIAYYRPYMNASLEFPRWSMSSYYKRDFTPMKVATNTFFSSLVCEQYDGAYISSPCKDEYTIVNGEVIRTSFKEGYVALAYTRQPLDDNGYPKIPDHYSYLRAIESYVRYRKAQDDFDAGIEGSNSRMQKYEADWHWYCKQASNFDFLPKGIDEFENLVAIRRNAEHGDQHAQMFNSLNEQKKYPWRR